MRDLLDCSSAGFEPGSCSDTVGDLDVVVGSTMYKVFINSFDRGNTEKLLDMFRIVG